MILIVFESGQNRRQTLLTTNTFDAANRVVQTIEPDGFTNKIIFNTIVSVTRSTTIQ